MHPILTTIGPITIQSLWFILSIGMAVSIIIFLKISKKNKIPLKSIYKNYTLLLIGSLIGARLAFVIINHYYFFPTFELRNFLYIFAIWDNGWSFWGGVITFIIFLHIVNYKEKQNTKLWWDTLIIPLLILGVFSSIGNFLDGRAYGRATNLPWGITFQNINVKYTVPVHPTQIYSAIGIIAIIFILKKYRSQLLKLTKNTEGTIAVSGLIFYCIFRLLEGFLRGDDAVQIFFLRLTQVLCIIGIIVGGLFFKKYYKKDTEE